MKRINIVKAILIGLLIILGSRVCYQAGVWEDGTTYLIGFLIIVLTIGYLIVSSKVGKEE